MLQMVEKKLGNEHSKSNRSKRKGNKQITEKERKPTVSFHFVPQFFWLPEVLFRFVFFPGKC
jgi:hypothetical protein